MLSDPSSGIDRPAAILLETVQGEGGLNAASDEWLRNIARISREHGALLIVDDIQAGVGRTGTFFSFEPSGIKPDIVTLAKSLSGYGLPMSLVLIDRKYDRWAPGEHNGTFRGNCHAFVTATEALRYFWRGDTFAASIREKAALVDERFAAIAETHRSKGVSVRGRGMMRGLKLPDGDVAASVVQHAFSEGLIVETSGPNDEVVKCLAALTISEKDLVRGLDILEHAIARGLRQHDRAAA
jgi:diaminobutyrate-2-oxoglutarate transaminase